MEWSKVKSILIVLLLIVNLLLGFNIESQIAAQRRAEAAGLHSALTLLSQQGARFDEQLFWDMPRSSDVLTGERSAACESKVAGALLGANSLNDAGGGFSIYTSRAGSATFRSGGLFEAELVDGTTAAQLLEGILKNTEVKGMSCERSESAGGVSAQLLLEGRAVVGCTLACQDTAAGARVSGRWYFGQGLRQEGVGVSRAEMAVALLGLEREKPLKITDLRIVYVQEPVRGGVRFVPVWQVSGAGGQIFLNNVTKREITAE